MEAELDMANGFLPFDDRNSRRTNRRDINEELVRRVASMTAWQIRRDAERRQRQFAYSFFLVSVSIIVGYIVGYNRARGGF
jgi:hypothetical protein